MSGLIVVSSSEVGANPHFVIHDYNGFVFPARDSGSLAKILERIMKLGHDDLADFSRRSKRLSQKINPETSAFNLLSVLR